MFSSIKNLLTGSISSKLAFHTNLRYIVTNRCPAHSITKYYKFKKKYYLSKYNHSIKDIHNVMSKEKNNKISYSTLKRYFDGEASNEESLLINKILSESESNEEAEKHLRNFWKDYQPGEDVSAIKLEFLLDRIHHKINLGRREEVIPLKKRNHSYRSIHSLLKYSARIAAILAIPLLGYLSWELNQKRDLMAQTEAIINEISCPLGVRSHFNLPDGTSVTLNNGSSLKYPTRFSKENRTVSLVGEAYFDVKHNQESPFIIETEGLDVKVLGTKLNIYSYPGEEYQEITLESGEIELLSTLKKKQISIRKMKPGQHAVYEYTKHKLDVKFDDVKKYTSWKDGRLVLRNDPASVFLKRIGRWYNVQFNIQDERVMNFTCWATFEE